ncbi:MAG TPA: DUF1553 domain-containing protein [Bryobacteraceae bacterium]|nr:DUF1553 domain-containing protein [Bryobacteraceae bacterium]
MNQRRVWASVYILAACAYASQGRVAGAVEFNRDVRPILSDNCFGCHGPDATAKKIPLRLDSEGAAKADLGGRRAVVEGDPAKSVLMQRITTDRKALRMPPAFTGHTLTEKEIETLRTWIAEGARWQKHWAFLPPVRQGPPEVQNKAWPKNAIDRFILQRLERENLTPSPEASKELLLRRVSLDITGLPPTPAEIDAFLKDTSPKAYEKVVDRLLHSPRYGERMAIRWLDASRYADTNGYQFDGERVMWRWRDWVIDSFNQNKPFDQFALEQIAGDMLPNATMEQKIATGFNRNHRANTEDGIIAEEYAVEYVVDRVETTSAVFMGATIGCARCHNHKYDPFTQKEFYQFFAYFNNIPELGRAMKYGNSPPLVAAPTHEQQLKLQALETRIRAMELALAKHSPATSKAQHAWEASLAAAPAVYWSPETSRDAHWDLEGDLPPHVGTPSSAPGPVGKGVALDGKSYLQIPKAGQFDIDERFSVAGWMNPACDTCTVFSRMVDGPKGKGYGVHIRNGKLFVTMTNNWDDDAIRYESEQSIEPKRWAHVAITYTGSRMAEGLQLYVDGKPAKVKVQLDTLYRPFRNAGRTFTEPFRIGAGNGAAQRFQGLVDDVHIYARVLTAEEIEALALGESLNTIAAKPVKSRTPSEKLQLRLHFLENAAPEHTRLQWKQLSALLLEKRQLENTFPTVMVMAESPTPKDTYFLQRGQYDKKGEKVQPGLPAVLPPLPQGVPNNRLGLAKWMVDPSNPLPARVFVNRTWQMVFGTGLVKTPEDFGLQGEWPSHPELLDWLATEFIRTGWDMKAMVKAIVMSATYRQSSKDTPELRQRDPENRLLARGPRTRMPAEMVRDNALFSAGLLREKLGGPSVKPYQPAGLWAELVMQDMDYVQSKGDDLYRRSLYTFWKRTVAPPMMANFDSALRETCVVRENRTNTPLQALNLMNDVTFVEAARFLGQRMLKEGGSDAEARLRYGFRLVTGRSPSAAEAAVLRSNLHYHEDYFATKPARVAAYLKQGDSAADPALNPAELAAYAAVSSLMFNLDEAITKE